VNPPFYGLVPPVGTYSSMHTGIPTLSLLAYLVTVEDVIRQSRLDLCRRDT
jgi:hypothetical protein